MKKEIIEMTQDQINRYVTIRNSLDGKITVADASSVLGISERQVIRLRNGVREEGAAFMKHKNTGTAPKHALTDEMKKRIMELYERDDYKGSNFQHFKELIEKIEGVEVSYSSIHRTLREAGHVSPKKRRKKKLIPAAKERHGKVCWCKLMPRHTTGLATECPARFMEP